MQTINIDGVDYDAAKLSPEAIAQLGSIRFVDQELERLQAQVAVLQTARLAYAGDSEMLTAMEEGRKIYQLPEMEMRKLIERNEVINPTMGGPNLQSYDTVNV